MHAATRLYSSAIALVSGLYSTWLGFGMSSMQWQWLMVLLGGIVIVHGLVLLTAFADRLGETSGPLMVVYGGGMFLLQLWMSLAGMGARLDPGMIALAGLMLLSGAIMWVKDPAMQ